MRAYGELNREELLAMKQEVEASYEEARGKGLKLDMSRGKPSKKQLDLAEGMLTVISSNEDCMAEDGLDCRNYGGPVGIAGSQEIYGRYYGSAHGSGDCLWECQSDDYVRYGVPVVYPRRAGEYPVEQTGPGEIPLSGSWL